MSHDLLRIGPAWALTLLAGALCLAAGAAAAQESDLERRFQDPPAQYRSWPLYWLNGKLDRDTLLQQMQAMRDQCGFGGLAPLAMRPTEPKYLSDDYFACYGEMLDTAERLGLKVVLYDDIDFPTGSAGGRMAALYPNDLLKNLQKVEEDVAGPRHVEKTVPPGKLMAAVAMETATKQRLDLAGKVAGGVLRWDAPAGNWKVMLFLCVPTPGARLVDYMDPAAVRKFLSLTYDEYYKRFGRHFGKTIVQAFFDDLALCYTPGGRTWTPAFNEKFRQKYGKDPALLYPALWYDIGPDTAAARVALFSTRADLMADGYVRTAGEWCRKHGIALSGHPAGNYNPQPVEVSGDNIKFYRYCDIPLLDSIHYYTHGRSGFKLITSAAFTYDRPITSVEIYGNYPDRTVDAAMLYRSAMELYARGANRMLPHGMWYDPAKMTIPPEISYRNPRFGAELPAYNRFVGRCSLLLQGGRHVADIGVLYPVAAMQAAYQFDVPGKRQPNWGYDAPPEADYLALSDALTGCVRRDFTFLHPEVIDERCTVKGSTLCLDNAVNREQYRVVILPGGKTIPWSCLRKVREFYEKGGRVIATTQLPLHSAEFGHDEDVRRTVESLFGAPPADAAEAPYRVRIEVAGTTIKTYVRGELVDTTTDATFAHGAVGFREADNEAASFRNLVVKAPDGQVLLQEDFKGGLGRWQNTENASAAGGRLSLKENQILRCRDGAAWSDYTIEVEIDAAEPVAGILFRAADDDNCYMWQFSPSRNLLRPHKVRGAWACLKEVHFGGPDYSVLPFSVRANAAGGKAYFAPHPTAGTLRAILDDALPVGDVRFEGDLRLSSGQGMLSYLHKVLGGRQVYYFANSTDDPVDTWVRLRGAMHLRRWDPHTGTLSPAEYTQLTEAGEPVTRVRLVLGPVKSVFLVEGDDTGKGVSSPRKLAGELPCDARFFTVAGRPAFLFLPKERTAATPWVLYAPTLDYIPDPGHLWMFRQLLEKGIAIAGVDVGESFGNPQGRAAYSALWERLTGEFGMAERACLLPQSRGGLMLYNWAAENPERVACVAGIYSVCDMASWPGLKQACGAYGMSEEQLARALPENNPIDRLAPLAAAGVPILHIHGDSDKVVPLERNAGELVRRYQELGGKARLIVVPGKGHQVVPEFFHCQEFVEFIVAQAAASITAGGSDHPRRAPATTGDSI